jgi:hypothetical protein
MSDHDPANPASICKKVESRLAEYSAGILANPARDRVARHLARCEACRARAQAMAQGVDQLRSWAAAGRREQVSATRVDSILAAVETGVRNAAQALNTTAQVAVVPSSRSRWLRFAPLAAALFLAGAAIGSLWASQRAEREEWSLLRERVARLEGAAPAIVEAAKLSMLPSLRDLAVSVDSTEQRYRTALTRFVELLEGRRRADIDALTGALADTRQNLQLTQSAVLRVAEAIPEVR